MAQNRVFTNKDLHQERQPPDIMDDDMDSPPDVMDEPDEQINEFYDYDKAIAAGAKPDSTGHWPSEFKLPGHPNEFVGGFSTITGEPNRNQRQETDVNKLVEQGYDPQTAQALIEKNTYKGPTTFMGGVLDSLNPFGGASALQASDAGAKGWLQGAILDIPQTVWEGTKGAFNLAKEVAPIPGNHPIDAITSRLGQIPEGLSNIASGIANTTQMAGSNPEAFGRMTGQMTGQPALMDLGIPMLPGIASAGVRGAGLPVEYAGKAMKNFQPISNTIPLAGGVGGGMPGFLGGYATRMMLRNIEKSAGKGIEKIGQRMRSKNGKTVELFDEPEIVDIKPSDIDSPKSVIRVEPEPIKSIRGLPLTPEQLASIAETGQIGKIADAVAKPKGRVNRDGTFTNMSTGEVFNKSGKPLETGGGIEKIADSLSKDSSFFNKNKHPLDIGGETGAIKLGKDPTKPKVKKSPDFTYDGNYDVEFPNGHKTQIFYDRQSQTWYENKPRSKDTLHSSHYSDDWGFSKDELLEKMKVRYNPEN